MIEPVYYNSVAYSIKNTYVIPKTIESKQYLFSTQDAKFRGLFSFFSDDLSTKTINIMPTIDSTNDLSPIFSTVNLMCYSEVKAYYIHGKSNRNSLIKGVNFFEGDALIKIFD